VGLNALADLTDGFVGADMKYVPPGAFLPPIGRLLGRGTSEAEGLKIGTVDFPAAISTVRCTSA
jgi:hypothetical protein